MKHFLFFQVIALLALAILVSRLTIARPASFGLCAPASSNRSLRLAAASPVLISIKSCARRSVPSASRFFAFRVVFEAIGKPYQFAIKLTAICDQRNAKICPTLISHWIENLIILASYDLNKISVLQ